MEGSGKAEPPGQICAPWSTVAKFIKLFNKTSNWVIKSSPKTNDWLAFKSPKLIFDDNKVTLSSPLIPISLSALIEIFSFDDKIILSLFVLNNNLTEFKINWLLINNSCDYGGLLKDEVL